MSPGTITTGAAASASPPPQPHTTATTTPAPPKRHFDDIFRDRFLCLVQAFKEDPHTGAITAVERKNFIDASYRATDEEFFGGRELSDHEVKMRAMTKVFYKVLAEEPWKDEFIRPHDVERKLSRWEMHRDSFELAMKHNIHNPREAVAQARQHLIELSKLDPKDRPGLRGPYDDIELIYIPGTVSSTATNKIDRDTIYPVSVSSVANVLHTHVCREMTRPYDMAEKFVTCTDTEQLTELRQWACKVVDFAPHLLDNDNVSLLIVLLILARSEITRRLENVGIRIEGSTISHRRAECLKTKLGWKNSEERKPFDQVSLELQTRVKNACFPAPRAQRVPRPKTSRKSSSHALQVIPATPPTGLFAPPPNGHMHQSHTHPIIMGPPLNYAQPPPLPTTAGPSPALGNVQGLVRVSNPPTASFRAINEPMDTS